MGQPNYNSELAVMIAARKVSAQCRLCLLRPPADSLLVYVKVYDGSQAFSYFCPDCYDYLRQRAFDDFKVEDFGVLLLRGIHGVELGIPAYYIKEHNPFLLYYPEPTIDLPLYRQRLMKRLATRENPV